MAKRILNEIKTADAYQKFYSDVDAEIYGIVTFGSKNLLNISKFILDYFRKSGKEYTAEIIEAIRKIGEVYGKMDNQSQVEVNNKAKMGQYASFEDLYRDFADREESVTDVAGLQYGKNGLIILLDNEDIRITCTPSYESSTKNFGDTKWCTASDVFGRYNGYYFFCRYTFYTRQPLPADFSNSGDYDRIKTLIGTKAESNDFNALVQIFFKKNRYIYQAQIHLGETIDGESVSTVCDHNDEEYEWEDVAYGLNDLDSISEDRFFEILNDNKALIAQNIRKSMNVEYAKMKKLDDDLREKVKNEKAKIVESVPSFIQQIQQGEGVDSFYKKVTSAYNDIDDFYEWYKSTVYVNSYQSDYVGYESTILTVIIGGSSNKLNNYARSNNLSTYLTILFKDNEIISYTTTDVQYDWRIVMLDGSIYCLATHTTERSRADIYSTKLEKLAEKYWSHISNFYVFSDNAICYRGQQLIGDDLEVYFYDYYDKSTNVGKYDRIDFTTDYGNGGFKVTYDFYRKDGTVVRTTSDELSNSTNEEIRDQIFKYRPQSDYVKMSSDDVATMVRECVLTLARRHMINEKRNRNRYE